MTMLYGNLADAALGERRFVREHLKQAAFSPAARLVCAIALAVAGLSALAVLGVAPDRFAEATPMIADLENWLIWGDLQRF